MNGLDIADELTRVYGSRSSRVAHILVSWGSPNAYSPALCGTSPDYSGCWFGTGSQAERDRADGLRLCAHCARILEEES